MSESAIPTQMQWRFKELRKILKETVKMTPSTGQSVMMPGNSIIVDLPYNSLCDWSTFTMSYTGQTNHAGSVVTGLAEYTRTQFFPRNSSSLIQNLQLKVNGASIFNVPDYNFVYNILYDYTQGGDAWKRRQTGGENANPSNKHYIVGNDIIERRGYSIAPYNGVAAGIPASLNGNSDLALDSQKYNIRSWIGPLGGNCSTNIIDSNILGIVSVEITLAPSSCLMLGVETSAGGVVAADNLGYKEQVGRPEITNNIAALAAGLSVAGQNINYSLDNVEFSIVRYHMPAEWYAAEASVLSSGHTYKLFYPNYSVVTGNPTVSTNKQGTHRFSISTKSLDYVIGTFRLPNYDTPGLPLNTIFSSDHDCLEEGSTLATAENQIVAGCKRVFNQSKYFAQNGDSITQCRWKCGFTEFPPQTLDEQFNSLLQHFNQHQDTVSGMYPGISSLGAFRETYYAHVLSLNISGENDMYTISGLDTQETPAVIEWLVEATDYAIPAAAYRPLHTVGATCTPYLIACYNSHLEIKAGRVISTIS